MDVWGRWSAGPVEHVFQGGPPELERYLSDFFSALSLRRSGLPERPVVFDWSHGAEPIAPATHHVIEGIYELGEDEDGIFFSSPGSWRVAARSDAVEVTLQRDGWTRHWDVLNQALTQAILVGLLRWRTTSVHGGCVIVPWGTALLVGRSQAGKSTLSLAAAAAGSTLVSDDRVFVSLVPPEEVVTLGAPITFRVGTAALIPSLAGLEATAPEGVRDDPGWRVRHKIAVDPAVAFGRARAFRAGPPLCIVVLARDDSAGAGTWRPIAPEEARDALEAADPSPIVLPARAELLDDLLARAQLRQFTYAFGDGAHLSRTAARLVAGPEA